jgi:hypothetical protein
MTEDTIKSPQILSSGWGKMKVAGLATGRDFKLWPGGGRNWDWSEHGTGHGRGVQREDVAELLAHGCRVVILTTGRFRRLRVPESTVRFLQDQAVEVVVTDTKSGVMRYNQLAAEGIAVGGLFHSTC